jgi:outer membrane protein assembly factor BamB
MRITRRDVLLMLPAAAILPRPGITLHAAASDWPAFRGPSASGVQDGFPLPTHWNADPQAGPDTGIRWKTRIPGLAHSSPIVWGNRLFTVTAVRDSGDAPLRLGLFGDSDGADDNVTQQWVIYCLDKSDGRIVWERTVRSGRPRSGRHVKATHANTTLATDGQRLICFLGSEGVHSYTLDGATVWSRDLGVINVSKYGIGWGFGASPAIFKDRIFLQCDAPDDPYLIALRLDNGQELWRTPRKEVCERSWATPFVYDHGTSAQVVANGWPFVVSYDATTGKELWRLRAGGDNPIPTPFAADGIIYVANGHGSAPVFAIRPTATGDISLKDGASSNSHVIWSDGQNGAYIQTPVVYRGLLYSGTNAGVLKCYDGKTGTRHYQQRLATESSAFSASPVAGDGKLYCTGEDGDVFVVRAGQTFEVLAHNKIGESCLATPAISEGTLFFRTRSHLVAVGPRIAG